MGMMGRFCILSLILCIAFTMVHASIEEDDFLQCESTVRKWAESSSDSGAVENPITLKDLLFFLHVPRTGGRSYFYCFLRKLYTTSQECPRSYDKLRFNPRKPNCRLIVTHDDYSLVTKLPRERTSVVTVMRDPIDRLFSTYEFSVEVAARFLVHPNLSSAIEMSGRIRPKAKGVSTLDIWPWKYLVPWMRNDLFARRDARELGKFQGVSDGENPYDMKDMIMPLHQYINDPLAHEIVHNGATFQLAGLTNNSYIAEAHEVRHCVRKHPNLGHFVLEIAKNRLNEMLYVGLTDDHKKSAVMFADLVGTQVLSQSEALNILVRQEASNKTDLGSSPSVEVIGSKQIKQEDDGITSLADVEVKHKNMTVGKLMDAYEKCVSTLRKTQSARRQTSLKKIAPANFSKAARRRVPAVLLEQILLLNNLDVELYKHAQKIFMERRRHYMPDGQVLQPQKYSFAEAANHMVTADLICKNWYWCSRWSIFLFSAAVLMGIVLVLTSVTTRRRAFKIKI